MVTTVSESFYDSLQPRPELKPLNDLELRGPDGGQVPYVGYIEATIEVAFITNSELFVPVLVVPSTEYNLNVPVIVGTNVIRLCKEATGEHCVVPTEWEDAFQAVHHGFAGKVMSTNRAVEIQPMETVTVSGFARKTKDVQTAVTETTDGISSKVGVCPRVVNLDKPGKNGRIPVRLFNMSAKVVTIPPRSPICELQEVKVIRSCDPLSTTEVVSAQQTVTEPTETASDESITQKLGVNLADSHLSHDQEAKVTQLFNKWQSIFSKGPIDLGNTDLVRHEIHLTEEKPFKEPYRRIAPALFQEVREHLAEMVAADAIRPSESPYSSNVVIVRKKDGTIRFCIDYRKLNLRTIKDAYAIPRIEDSLHLLAGSRFFSTLDLKAGYWQVELKEEDKQKTAFQVANLGFFECNRMPFGLCNAPATFQRLMERCMGDLNLQQCLIYLDDIVIFSSSFEQQLDRLEAVFERLHRHNLKLKASKCEFFKREVKYLGHIVSEDGIKADPAKTSAIKEWPVPASTKEVRRFIGFSGYYRRFVKDYAKIARPLNDLLVGEPTSKSKSKKKTHQPPFHWGDEQQQAFDAIVDKLSSPPVLAYAEYDKPFALHTDASSSGLGAVLYQKQNGIDRVIAYASRSLKPSEKNYPAHKLEFLALKWAITDKFHDYLYGATFEAISDNNPLTYALTTAKLDATGQRWIAALSNYNFRITYRSGKKNLDADGLSRRVSTEKEERTILPDSMKAIFTMTQTASEDISAADCLHVDHEATTVIDTIPEETIGACALSTNDWRNGQAADPAIARVVRLKRFNQRPTTRQTAQEDLPVRRYLREWDKLLLRDDVLLRKAIIRGQEVEQTVLPESARNTILCALHDDLGHQGRDRTSSLVKERYFWPGMDGDIRRKVQNCDRCIRQKVPPQRAAELVPITSTAPMEIVCVDYLSLETSKGGYENVLVITDHFTRYAMAIPTRNQTAKTTARALFECFFLHYGFPAKLHSDRGQNFESKTIRNLCKIAKIKKTRTTPYHPMGNGQVERFNQTLIRMLGTLDQDKKVDWKAHIPTMVHAYNATRHESTSYAPFYLMFGRQPRLAIDAFLGIGNNTISGKSHLDYAQQLDRRLNFAYSQANEESARQAERHKTHYDRRVRENHLQPGDRVLVRNVGLKGKHKLADRWEEDPYIVISQPDEDIPVYQVKKENSSGRLRTLHRNHLLPFMSLPSPKSEVVAGKQKDQDFGDASSYTSDADDELDSSDSTAEEADRDRPATYRIPMRRSSGERGVYPRTVSPPGSPETAQRLRRNRRSPQRYEPDDWRLGQQHVFVVPDSMVVRI